MHEGPGLGSKQRPEHLGSRRLGSDRAIRDTHILDAGVLKLSRSWVWEPKTGQITCEGSDKAGNPVEVT